MKGTADPKKRMAGSMKEVTDWTEEVNKVLSESEDMMQQIIWAIVVDYMILVAESRGFPLDDIVNKMSEGRSFAIIENTLFDEAVEIADQIFNQTIDGTGSQEFWFSPDLTSRFSDAFSAAKPAMTKAADRVIKVKEIRDLNVAGPKGKLP